MTSCRGLNTYPQGPAGEPGTNGRRGLCSTGGWDIYQKGKYNVWKGNSWHTWGSFVKCCNNTWTENVENVRSVLTWWWGEIEGRQMGWEGLDEKGRGEKAINISGWKKKGGIKHWGCRGEKGHSLCSQSSSKKRLQFLWFLSDKSVWPRASQELQGCYKRFTLLF